MSETLLRHLPSVRALRDQLSEQRPHWPDALATTIARDAVRRAREQIQSGNLKTADQLQRAVQRQLRQLADAVDVAGLRPVINGTGVLVHTNAGRAPLSAAALEAVNATSSGYCNLELGLTDGKRGSRQTHLRDLVRWLTGAEDALVVNNNAAAVMLTLHALAQGRPVLVSRGELVEIGGSFRVPDVMAAAGARLVEVGTTNRTWLRDYERAAEDLASRGDPPAIIMQIHRSNFRQQGFVATPTLEELSGLARRLDIPLVSDLGSGAISAPERLGLADEPTVAQTLAAGADIATFSGDKLLGGPQAGLIAGRRRWLQQMSRNAMARAVRVGSMTVAALQQTLRQLLLGADKREIPVLAAAALSVDTLRADAERVVEALGDSAHVTCAVITSSARVGGGSQPEEELPSIAVTLDPVDGKPVRLAKRLRTAATPVLPRVHNERVLIDMRSVRCTSNRHAIEGLIEALGAALNT